MNRIKLNYIKALLLCMCLTVSAPSFAQKQKKEKQKKEQTQKPKKQDSMKSRFIEFANEKVAKPGTPEYNAQRQAAIIVMDSLIHISGNKAASEKLFGEMIPAEALLKFTDLICAKFNNDTLLMDSVAQAYYMLYGNEIYGQRRYDELKQLHPEYTKVYINEGRLFHALSYRPNEEGKITRDTAMLAKAKEQFDSAKIVMPASAEPYLVWMRLQAKYDEKDADEEIERLKTALPNFPAHLEAARYYDMIATGNYNYLLLNALHHYEQVDTNSMKASDIAGYSLLLNRANGVEYWERGVSLAKFGLSKYAEDKDAPSLYRFGLWNAGKAKKWEDAIEMGKGFFEKADTMQKLVADYKWYAKARLNNKEYEDVLALYKQEIVLPDISVSDYSDALGDMVDCYRYLGRLDDAKKTFAQYEAYKLENGKTMEAFDYIKIANAYNYALADTTLEKSVRLSSYLSLDSIVGVAVKASPEYTYLFNSMTVNSVRSYLMVRDGEIDITDDIVREVTERAIAAELAYQSTLEPLSIPSTSYYGLMEDYKWLLEYYANAGSLGMENAYNISQKMLELPLAMELDDLSSSRSRNYMTWTSRAEQISNILGKTYGRKKGKR